MIFDALHSIPAPAGSRHVAEWVDESGNGTAWGRYVRGGRHAAAGVTLTMCGWQDASGAIERHASVSAPDVELDAAGLRRLAALALDAADELESLGTDRASEGGI